MILTTQLTYFFGAGASFKSMPIVSNFTIRFEAYVNFLENGIKANREFVQVNRKFIGEVKSHLSFDTFFKKLFHQNEEELTIRYKYLILLFFIYEHIANVDDRIPVSHTFDGAEKEYCLDPRYDALIAGLLKPIKGACEFYSEITFLTWNYDNNLLFSLFNFLGKNTSFNASLKNIM